MNSGRSGGRGGPAFAAAVLAAVVLLGHGGSLGDGLFFDDYWHRATLRDYGWGFDDLVEAATFNLPGELAHLWWQERPLQWRYARPVAMFFMKIEYRLSGGNPVAVHAFALLWHWATAMLVYGVARRALGVMNGECRMQNAEYGMGHQRHVALRLMAVLRSAFCILHSSFRHFPPSQLLALLCAAVFVLNPHHVFGVSWIAARNALVSGFFFMAAVYLYMRASQAKSELRMANNELRNPPPGAGIRSSLFAIRDSPAVVLAAALFCWLLALFSRETAIIFPAVALMWDLATGAGGPASGRSRRRTQRSDAAAGGTPALPNGEPASGRSRLGQGLAPFVIRHSSFVIHTLRTRLPVYAAMAVLGGGYLYWRLAVFPVAGPPDIYFTTPTGPAYALWAGSKLLHMLFAMAVQTPMFLGLATYAGVSAQNLLEHAVILAVVGGLTAWYLWASRGLPTRWVWPAWLVLGFVPVIPVFVMPHFAYLSAPALAIMIGVIVRATPAGCRRGLLLCIVFGSTLFSTTVYRFAWRGIVRCEQALYADMRENTPPPTGPTKLVLIDFPIAGIYAGVAMREAWDNPQVEAHFLTFAPHPLAMLAESTVEMVGERELLVSTPAPGYFSGLSGRMTLDGMRPDAPLKTGDTIPGPLFDTTVVEADGRGVTRLRFAFHQPLDAPGMLFYVSTPSRPAMRLTFEDGAAAPATTPEQDRAWRERAAELLRERQYYFTVIEIAGRLVRSDLYLTGEDEAE